MNWSDAVHTNELIRCCPYWWIDQMLSMLMNWSDAVHTDELIRCCPCPYWWIDQMLSMLMNWSDAVHADELIRCCPYWWIDQMLSILMNWSDAVHTELWVLGLGFNLPLIFNVWSAIWAPLAEQMWCKMFAEAMPGLMLTIHFLTACDKLHFHQDYFENQIIWNFRRILDPLHLTYLFTMANLVHTAFNTRKSSSTFKKREKKTNKPCGWDWEYRLGKVGFGPDVPQSQGRCLTTNPPKWSKLRSERSKV